MAYNAIIFKIPTGKDKFELVIPYHDGFILPRGSLKKVVRDMEEEYARHSQSNDEQRKAIAINWLLTQPSVVSIGDKLDNLVEQGIVKLPYKVITVAIGGNVKFYAVQCLGEKAQFYYEKGKRPMLTQLSATILKSEGKAKSSGRKSTRTRSPVKA